MDNIVDLATIGAGPSALTAAIYAGRAGLKTMLLERQLIGGQMSTIDRVDNYPGFADGVTGLELAQYMEDQARRFGAEIKFTTVTDLTNDGDGINLATDTGSLRARTVLIATGLSCRRLGIDGEQKYYGRGVHYCATCDGAFYKGKELVVVGGANAAVQETLFLIQFASHTTMLVRSYLKADATVKRRLQQQIETGKVTLIEGCQPIAILGDDAVTGVEIITNAGNDTRIIKCDGVFVFVGSTPNTAFLHGSGVELENDGLVKVESDLQTTMPLVWAGGNVRSNATKQIVSAAGDGATAAINISKYLGVR